MSASADARWLAAAACLAERARPLSRPNPAVGAILVRNGRKRDHVIELEQNDLGFWNFNAPEVRLAQDDRKQKEAQCSGTNPLPLAT